MSVKLARFSLFVVLLVSNNVFSGWYAGGLFTITSIDFEVAGGQAFSPMALTVNGGYDFHKYAALELRAGIGITKGKRANSGVQRTLDLNYMYGSYLKLQTGNKNINPYILIGYTKAELEASNGTITAKADDNDISYGIGIEGPLSETSSFNLEFMQYYDKESIDIKAIGVGIISRF